MANQASGSSRARTNAKPERGARLVRDESHGRCAAGRQLFNAADGVTDTGRVRGLNDPRWALEVKPGPVDRLDDSFNEMRVDIQNGEPVIQRDR